MFRPIKDACPLAVRQVVQPRYDDYMRGSRVRLNMWFDGMDEILNTTDAESRAQAYETFALRWPKKSQQLMTNVAREAIFSELCLEHHRDHCEPLLTGLDDAMRGAQEYIPPAYISGLGRNACIATVLLRGEMREVLGTFAGIYAALNISASIGRGRGIVDSPLVIDPDFGLGGLDFKTPELFDTQKGSVELAESGAKTLTEVLEAVHAADTALSDRG